MTIKEIIDGLKFTMEMCLYNPTDGSMRPVSTLNDMDKTTYDACEGAIQALEQQRWTPVSEGLPKNTGWYLITFKTTNGVAVCELSYRKPENYWTDKDISKKVFDNNDVIAWMPKPQPYKAESEDKE